MEGKLFLFDKIIGNLDGETIDVHLQFIIVDDFVTEQRIKPAPVLEVSIDFPDLWDKRFFHEDSENSN